MTDVSKFSKCQFRFQKTYIEVWFIIIIIIIIIVLTSVFPNLHRLDGSPKCYFSIKPYLVHLLFSTPFSHVIRYTHSFQVFLPLPLPFSPATEKSLHAETQSSSSFRSTCPIHLNLFWRTLLLSGVVEPERRSGKWNEAGTAFRQMFTLCAGTLLS